MMVRGAADVLLDAERRAEWPAAEAVLRQAGAAAYAELVRIVAFGDSDAAVRAGALLGFDEVTEQVRRTIVELRSPDPDERHLAAFVLGYEGAEPLLPWARVLTTLLADPNSKVSLTVVSALAAFGRDVLSLLREVRRSSLPERRGALTALAEFGWDEIDPADRQALARLIAVKQTSEVPEPVVPVGEWFAVPTSDRQAVLDAFGLSAPVPITMRAGFTQAQGNTYRRWSRAVGNHDHVWCAQMFVTPVLDGWTLVVGAPVHDDELTEHRAEQPGDEADAGFENKHEARQRRCVELSRRLRSAVYWYAAHDGDDWTAWCLADNGTLVRYYHHDFSVGEVEVGEPLPAESGLHEPTPGGMYDVIDKYAPPDVARTFIIHSPDSDLYDDDDEFRKDDAEWHDWVLACFAEAGIEVPDPRDQRYATLIAGRTSVGLTTLGPDTRVAGHGVLALTACGRLNGHRGAFAL
ncbi:HEAT repeat domain-containing protein [Saccharomonospora sp. NPDC046836]|uniref:HEAT repeat domain-containing protein n=1 Tax=Saccharomonospora sp. NPDC046836 TaxID=3156921 RepID=UPI00340975C3